MTGATAAPGFWRQGSSVDADMAAESLFQVLSDQGAGVPLRELALVGLTAAIVTYFATGGCGSWPGVWVLLPTRVSVTFTASPHRGWADWRCTWAW